MDGTLLDSMVYWRTLDRAFLEMQGYELKEADLARLATMTTREGVRYIRRTLKIEVTDEQISSFVYKQMERYYSKDVVPKEGALDYVRQLSEDGVKIAVATATASSLAIPVLKRLGFWELLDYFQSCQDIGVGKDRPDVYLDCCRELGCEPAECAVFEDAPYALVTAHAAGFHTVLIDDESYRNEQKRVMDMADQYIVSMAELLDNEDGQSAGTG